MARVLVIDDVATNREVLITLLHHLGHETAEAGDGGEGLVQVARWEPHLIVCDILMPSMDGFEFVKQLRKDLKHHATPVVFYTATFLQHEAWTLARSCGVEHVITKPCEPDLVIDVLNSALAGRSTSAYPPEILPIFEAEFDAEHLKLLTRKLTQSTLQLQTANQRLGLQLEHLQAEVATRERAERLLELEHAVAKALAAAETLGEGQAAVVATVCERLGWQMGRFWRVDDTRQAMTIATQWVKPGSSLLLQAAETSGGVLPRGVGLAGLVWQTGEPLWVPQLRNDPRLAQAVWRESTATGSASLFPVKVGERVVGVLSFLSDAAQLPDAAMHQTASGVAQQLGQFIARREAEQSLDVSERFNRAALNALAEQIGVLDAVGRVLAVNKAWRALGDRLADSTWRPAEGGLFFAESTQPDASTPYLQTLQAGVREVLTGQRDVFSLSYPITDRDLTCHWFLARVTRFEQGEQVRVVIAHEDITERKVAELRAQRLMRVTGVLSAINSLIVRVNNVNELYQEACRLAVETGRFLRAWIGLVDPDSRLPVMQASCEGARKMAYFERFDQILDIQRLQKEPRFLELMSDQKPIVINDIRTDSWMGFAAQAHVWNTRSLALFPLTHQRTTVGWLSLHSEEVDFFDAEECRLLSELAGDISFAMSHIRQSENMQRLAYYDQLTGCANRNLFHDRLSQSIAMAVTMGQSLVLAILDVDGFKSINDNLGRHVGDSLLQQVGRRVVEVAGDASRVARVGADQFALMLPGAPADFELLRTSQQVYEKAFAPEFSVGGDSLQVGAKVGLAIYPRDGADADELFGHAEAALKRAKRVGERVVFYDAHISAVVAEKFDIERRLRQALQRDEFLLHYQPKYDMRTGRMGSVEALIRWNSPDTGLVPPAKFIPLMEETGLIVDVGRWIFRQAGRDRRTWLAAMGRAPRVSVNVAAKQLQDGGFLALVKEALQDGGADPGLDIEITESGLVGDFESTIAKLLSLREMGVGLAVDDFGTGYSSLSYLARLPLTELKIDQSFVRAMLIDPAADTLVSSMVSLAKALKMSCVAEGVETREQAQRLQALDCDQVQGYLTGHPVDADRVPVLYQRDASEILHLLRPAE